MSRKIVQISSFGVENNAGTQCNYVTTALCDDGSVWSCRDVDSYWMSLPEIPPAAKAAPEPATVADAVACGTQREPGSDPICDCLKAAKRDKLDADRQRFMDDDDGGWTKHTAFHWSRTVKGQRLDYWPSRKKFQYQGLVMVGDVGEFIAKLLAGGE